MNRGILKAFEINVYCIELWLLPLSTHCPQCPKGVIIHIPDNALNPHRPQGCS